jgi:electron transfer flavoprotein beta subunit
VLFRSEVDGAAAFTVVKEANNLRMPSLKGKVNAKKALIPTWGAAELNPDPNNIGLKGSPTKVNKVFTPPIKVNRETLTGEPAEIVKTLIHKLKERKVL